MLVDNKKIMHISSEQKHFEKLLKQTERELSFAERPGTKQALEWQIDNLRMKIRSCKSRIQWEKDRYNFKDGAGYKKAKQLCKYIGSEVTSSYSSDKGTPQILLGIRYRDSELDSCQSRYLAIIRFWCNGHVDTKECFVDFVNPVK